MDIKMFNPGDVVFLKSGGAAMTVETTHDSHVQVVFCDYTIRHDGFNPECLVFEKEVHKHYFPDVFRDLRDYAAKNGLSMEQAAELSKLLDRL